MTYYWTLKLNEATARRTSKLQEEGVNIDTTTHTGRKQVGYNYLEYVKQED